MAGNRYERRRDDGVMESRRSIQTSAGVGSAGEVIAANALGKIDDTFLSTASTVTCTTLGDLSDGNFVNLYDNGGGVLVARKTNAAAATPRRAHGFVKAATLSGADAVVYLAGVNSAATGVAVDVNVGTTYFLSDATPGGAVTTPPSGTGDLVQYLGFSLAGGDLMFDPGEPEVLA